LDTSKCDDYQTVPNREVCFFWGIKFFSNKYVIIELFLRLFSCKRGNIVVYYFKGVGGEVGWGGDGGLGMEAG